MNWTPARMTAPVKPVRHRNSRELSQELEGRIKALLIKVDVWQPWVDWTNIECVTIDSDFSLFDLMKTVIFTRGYNPYPEQKPPKLHLIFNGHHYWIKGRVLFRIPTKQFGLNLRARRADQKKALPTPVQGSLL